MSSTKSSRPSGGHVIETNASGIITIVIDDDKEPAQDTSDSSDECSLTCRSSRTPIGVRRSPRSPVTPGSPKFINSDNCQNILIKENKTNVIVVSSGRATAPLRADQSRVTPTTLCCSPSPSHHNIISKTQTHYVVINKPKPAVSSTASSPITSSPSSPEIASKSSPTKLRLWTQPVSQSTPKSPPVVVSTRTRSHTNLPPDDIETDCIDENVFFKYLNLIPVSHFKNKPKLELRTSWPLRKVNKIAKPETNIDGKLLLANFKLLQEPIKSVPNMTPMLSQRRLVWYREAQSYNEKLQNFRANLPLNLTVRQRIQSELERVHNRLMSEKSKQNADEEKFRRMKAQEETLRIQKQELSQELNSYANAFEISSLMGRRVHLSLKESCLDALQIYNLNARIEKHCNQTDMSFVSAPQSTKLSTRITRSTTSFAGLEKIWGSRSESHQYSFTRRQRLNRYMKLETGLNWKSRLVKKHCRRIDVEVAKYDSNDSF